MFSSAITSKSAARVVRDPRAPWGSNLTAARAAMRASDNTSPFEQEAKAEVEFDDNGNETSPPLPLPRRRQALASSLLAAAAAASAAATVISPDPALAAFQPPGFKKDLKKGARRRQPLPEEAFSAGPEGLKFYDFKVGMGPEATLGDRVVVHYEARWKGVTFMTSRQGMGVTGGNPLGFDVGAKEGAGGTLKGLDLGVRGMRVGGQRRLLVPPELGYGKKGIGEVPGGATLEFEVELLSVKNSPLGYRVKLVEG